MHHQQCEINNGESKMAAARGVSISVIEMAAEMASGSKAYPPGGGVWHRRRRRRQRRIGGVAAHRISAGVTSKSRQQWRIGLRQRHGASAEIISGSGGENGGEEMAASRCESYGGANRSGVSVAGVACRRHLAESAPSAALIGGGGGGYG